VVDVTAERRGGRAWWSVHLHWPGALEPVLVDAVAPLVAGLEADGWIRGFFFVRYWEGGQHLRLRFDRRAGVSEGELERRVRGELAPRLRQLPAPSAPPVAGLPEAGAIVCRPYEPEVERYGGRRGLAVAESCFEGSSRRVLAWLADPVRAGRVVERGVLHGFAAALLAVSAHAFGLERAAASSFLTAAGDDGLRQVRPRREAGAAAWPSEERLRRAFEDGYRRQRAAVAPRILATWRAAGAGTLGPLEEWHRFLAAAVEGLLGAWRAGELLGAARGRWPQGEGLAADCWPVAGILFDLLHMTHNRLGIENVDEISLAWLVGRALAAEPGR
jgi:thiopeptide-type bacteriocin biosynthesis protein